MCGVYTNILAQEYIKEGRKRLNFAKTYFELGAQHTPSFIGKQNSINNVIQSFENSATITPYLNIGALHFWGHADFYLTIPLSQIYLNRNDSINFNYNQAVVTGARFLPWAYKDKKIRPYVGASWTIANLKQETRTGNSQSSFTKSKINADVGLLYGKGSFMARLGVNISLNNNWGFPITETSVQQIATPLFTGYFGIVYAIETTRSKNMERENERLNNYSKISSPTKNAIKKGDWFFGIGPSTSFILAKSDYNTEFYPYFNQKPISNAFFDLAFGYQFNRAGIVTAVSYRNPAFTNEAFGVLQTIKTNSYVVEAYKFLTDYSGFTPYVGLNIAFNDLNYSEVSNKQNLSLKTTTATPGLTFGWDILPGKTEQWFVLRTNLRWFPFQEFNVADKAFSLNQIEYNVIQAVFYPSRYKNAKNKR